MNNAKKISKIKVLSAIIGVPLCCVAMFLLPLKYAIFFFSAVTGIAAYEFTFRTGLVKNKNKGIVSVCFSVAMPWLFYFEAEFCCIIFAVFIYICLLFIFSMAEKRSDLNELFVCFFGTVVFSVLLSLCVVMLKGKYGKILLALPFISSWVADSFAHIFGSLFGKHKLIPHISPNKTTEGAVAALFGGVFGTEVFALILHLCDYDVNLIMFGIVGLLGAVFGMLGDLSLSYIKRKCSIKDYGNLIPGHGGVLDRFDSTMFVLPVVLFISEQTTLIY